MGHDSTETALPPRGKGLHLDSIWLDPTHRREIELKRALEDPWLDGLWRSLRVSVLAFFTIVLIGLVVHLGLVFADCYQAETLAKADAKRLFDYHCHQMSGISAVALGECVRQKHILERGTVLNAWHHTVQHHMEEIPGYAYCRAHEDMCGLMWLRVLEIAALCLYWIPVVAGLVATYYLAWPALMSLLFALIHRNNNNSSNSSSPPSKKEP